MCILCSINNLVISCIYFIYSSMHFICKYFCLYRVVVCKCKLIFIYIFIYLKTILITKNKTENKILTKTNVVGFGLTLFRKCVLSNWSKIKCGAVFETLTTILICVGVIGLENFSLNVPMFCCRTYHINLCTKYYICMQIDIR